MDEPETNVRQAIVAMLKPLLPSKWNVRPISSLPDTIETTTVLLTFQRYERHKTQGNRIASFVITILQPKTAPGAADDALDDDVIDLLNAIDNLPDRTITWTTAERGNAAGLLGFDITLTVPIIINRKAD